MARSRASAKKAGTAFETELAVFLTDKLGVPVRRLPKSGAKDIGDLDGVKLGGRNVVLEAKNPGATSQWSVSGWWSETEVETANAEAVMGILVIRRARKSTADAWCVVSDQYWDLLAEEDTPEPEKVGGMPYQSWPVSNGHPVRVPRRGREDTWVVFTVADMTELVDNVSRLPRSVLTPEQAVQLYSGQPVTVPVSTGGHVVLSVSND